MKRFTWTLALLALGCETNETAMTITHVILPELDMTTLTCKFDASSAKAGPLNLDTGDSLTLSIPFAVANNLSVRASDFSPTEEEAPVVTAAEITPVRFDARFECDTSAYSGARASGLILPRIDPQTSFCTDRRADSAASSANSDVLTAYGAAVKPAEIGTAMVRFPHELGYAIDELFDIARLADDCCRNTPNCGGSGGYMACVELQDIFSAIDGTGSLVAQGSPTEVNPTLQRFADYAVYDGGYIQSADTRFRGKSSPVFSMYMRGALQGVTGYGELLSSNDYSVQIDVCRNCGPSASQLPESPCIRD
jgi:hypothetical protein